MKQRIEDASERLCTMAVAPIHGVEEAIRMRQVSEMANFLAGLAIGYVCATEEYNNGK
jgi:hypothetical protein